MADAYADDYAGRLCERYEPSLLVLGRMDSSVLRSLRAALLEFDDSPTVYSRRDLAEVIRNHAESLTQRGLEIVDLLVDLVVTSRASRTPLVNLVESTARECSRVNADIDPVSFAELLLPLVDTSCVRSLAVDEDLLAENAAVYIDARILRDLRPAYQEDVAGDPIGISRYISQQRLRIRYWSEGRERVFEVTMRDEDLADLERWIFRAKGKLPLVPNPILREDVHEI